MTKAQRQKTWKQAVKHLRRDKRLKKWIHPKNGVEDFTLEYKFSPYEFLLRSIISQQISGAAARSILNKFLDKFPNRKVDFAKLLQFTNEDLRSAGISKFKMNYLRDLAEKVTSGTLPPDRKLIRMTDTEIIETVTVVKGIGVWTAEMLLIFRLGRMDVFPIDDLVVKKGFLKIVGKKTLPHKKHILKTAEAWRPYRTVVAKLCWAIA